MQKIKLELQDKTVLQKIADGEAIAPQLIADPDAQVSAAGTALGVVAHDFNWRVVLFVASSVVALSLVHAMLRPRLRDLL